MATATAYSADITPRAKRAHRFGLYGAAFGLGFIFGPVVGVATYDDWDEALRLANDTRYGLQAGVFTSDLGKALDAGRRLDFGGVMVNEVPTWRADQMPYGGVRDSGNTREGPPYAVLEMTERRLVVMQP